MNKTEIKASDIMNFYLNSLKTILNEKIVNDEFNIVKVDNDIIYMTNKLEIVNTVYITLDYMIDNTESCRDAYLNLLNSDLYSDIDDFRHIVFMYTHYNSLLYKLLDFKKNLNDDDLEHWFFNNNWETYLVKNDNVETTEVKNNNVETETVKNNNVEIVPPD